MLPPRCDISCDIERKPCKTRGFLSDIVNIYCVYGIGIFTQTTVLPPRCGLFFFQQRGGRICFSTWGQALQRVYLGGGNIFRYNVFLNCKHYYL